MFEEFIRNSRTDRYNILCSIDAHEKEDPSLFDDGSSGGDYTLPLNPTTESLVSLSATIDFIDCCIQGLKHISL